VRKSAEIVKTKLIKLDPLRPSQRSMRQISNGNGYSTAEFKDPKSRDYEMSHEPRAEFPESTYGSQPRLNNKDSTITGGDVDTPYEKTPSEQISSPISEALIMDQSNTNIVRSTYDGVEGKLPTKKLKIKRKKQSHSRQSNSSSQKVLTPHQATVIETINAPYTKGLKKISLSPAKNGSFTVNPRGGLTPSTVNLMQVQLDKSTT
jgi:hypothetical protein